MTDRIVSIGRIVHYKLDAGPNKGEYRPAIVVRDWGNGCVNLQVFTDASEDMPNCNDDLPCPYWVTSRLEGTQEGQWIWPPKVSSPFSGDGQVVETDNT